MDDKIYPYHLPSLFSLPLNRIQYILMIFAQYFYPIFPVIHFLYDIYLRCERMFEKIESIIDSVIESIVSIFSPEEKHSEMVTIQPVLPKTEEDIYMEKEKERFLRWVQSVDSSSKNTNIDSIFYDLKKYKECMMTTNNELELKWKRNILMESTPRGNVIFFFDAYKKGFSYYSDRQSISYPLLNVIAMKYVRVFSCYDFFMDDSILPNSTSPLIQIEIEEEKKEIEKKKSNIPIDKELLKKAPFAKLKKYGLSTASATSAASATTSGPTSILKATPSPNDTTTSVAKLVVKNVNRFLYLGKIHNYTFLQKIPKKRVIIQPISTSYDALFESNHALQTEVLQKETLSYKDFKALRDKKE